MKCRVGIVAAVALGANAYYTGDDVVFHTQTPQDGYNIYKFFGPYGPYVDRASLGISRDPPANCKVDQVIMSHRHGERAPVELNLKPFDATRHKLDSYNFTSYGSLGFYNDWEWFVESDGYYALETYSGPRAGLSTAFKRGAEFRDRYGHLWDQQSKLPIWTGAAERMVQTARKFGEGFLGWNYTELAEVNAIAEFDNQGANSLSPVCGNSSGGILGHSEECVTTLAKKAQVAPQYLVAAERLNDEYKGLNITADDVNSMMSWAGFELMSRKWSPWVNLFTKEEWIAHAHQQTAMFYYCMGPGARGARAMGSIWANATYELLKQGPDNALPMYWSFAHDVDISKNVLALGLSPMQEDLPINGTIPFNDPYPIADIVPMGAHLLLERMSCQANAIHDKGVYIRAVLNEAVVPFANCQDGPGFSCSLEEYGEKVIEPNQEDYITTCKIPKEYPQYLDFFWNYNHTGVYNHQRGDIPWKYEAWFKH